MSDAQEKLQEPPKEAPQSARWEQIKANQIQRLEQLKIREANLMGGIEKANSELTGVRLDIAAITGGLEAGDVAVKNVWEEMEEQVRQECKKAPATRRTPKKA
jgi:hypothetical protein